LKKRVSKEPHSQSPRELARYAVANTEGVNGIFYDEGSVEFQRSFYNEHLRDMSKEEYIEYLEQLVREVDYKWVRELAHASYIATSVLKQDREFSKRPGMEDSGGKRQVTDRMEKDLEVLKDYLIWHDSEFATTEYFTYPTFHSLLTRHLWDEGIGYKKRKT